MASFTKHKDGWRAHVYVRGVRVTKVFQKRREAQAWAAAKEVELDGRKANLRTFGQAAQEYLKRETVRKSARQWEANTFARLTAQIGADTPMAEIDQPTIARWRDDRLTTVSGSTVNREANLLRHLFTVARLEWKWISHNPFEGVKLPKENRPRAAVWPWQLIKLVLRAERHGKTAEMQRAFHIALRTGMRLSEVLAAKLAGNIAILPKDKTTQDGPVKVPLTRHGRQLLTSSKPFTVDPNEGSVLFSKLCRELLIEGLTFHDSRATALTHLSRKVDVLTLSKISRHRDLRILQHTYYRETAEQIAARI